MACNYLTVSVGLLFVAWHAVWILSTPIFAGLLAGITVRRVGDHFPRPRRDRAGARHGHLAGPPHRSDRAHRGSRPPLSPSFVRCDGIYAHHAIPPHRSSSQSPGTDTDARSVGTISHLERRVGRISPPPDHRPRHRHRRGACPLRRPLRQSSTTNRRPQCVPQHRRPVPASSGSVGLVVLLDYAARPTLSPRQIGPAGLRLGIGLTFLNAFLLPGVGRIVRGHAPPMGAVRPAGCRSRGCRSPAADENSRRSGRAIALLMPGARSRSSSAALFTARAVPKCISSARFRLGPMPGTSSSVEVVRLFARFCRCVPMAKRCASSRSRWR